MRRTGELGEEAPGLSITSCQMLKATEHLGALMTPEPEQMTPELENLIKMQPDGQRRDHAATTSLEVPADLWRPFWSFSPHRAHVRRGAHARSHSAQAAPPA